MSAHRLLGCTLESSFHTSSFRRVCFLAIFTLMLLSSFYVPTLILPRSLMVFDESGEQHPKNISEIRPILLSLDKLASNPSVRNDILQLNNMSRESTVSVVNITQMVFLDGENRRDRSNCLKSTIQDSEEIISQTWDTLKRDHQDGERHAVTWLLDIVGDSYSRWQFTTLSEMLAMGRKSERVHYFGSFGETYHKHKVFCCPLSEDAVCTLRLQHFSFNHTIQEQVMKQGADMEDATVCLSWQWSTFSNDKKMIEHLQRHGDSNSSIVPRGVLLNQGLHCAKYDGSFMSQCREKSRKEVDVLARTLHFSRGIKFIVQTAPIVAGKNPQMQAMINNTLELNAVVRSLYRSNLNLVGDNAHLWLADIENWSRAMRMNSVCEADDNVHLKCNLFVDVLIGWSLNYIVGNLRLSARYPSMLEMLPSCSSSSV